MFAALLKYDPAQPREPKGTSTGGQFTSVAGAMASFKAKYPVVAKNLPRSTYTEMGSIESHTTDVGREWVTQLTSHDLHGISDRFGSDVERLMTAAIPLHDIGKAEAYERGESQHQHSIPILQEVLRQEGFSDKDITLATELLNHDLMGNLVRSFEDKTAETAAKLTEKAQKVGMGVEDFTTLQLAFYQADAAAYPYITSFMQQEPSGRWTFAGNKKLAALQALIHKRDYVREPAGTSEGGQFAKATGTGGLDPKKKETWYRKGGGWHVGPEGEKDYQWEVHLVTQTEDYEPPPIVHKLLRGSNAAIWGGSHHGSSVITGESAQQMGIDGYNDLDATKEAKALTTRMLQEIASDTTGAEEILYHAFENTRGTVFRPGDTMRLPLTATAGEPQTTYATRAEWESQEGAPTVFVFPKGTKMVAYGKWPTNPKQRGYEDGNAKEFGHVYSEAIVAGKFRVEKVETKYFGSQHSRKPLTMEDVPQLYGQVVHVTPIEYFNPETKKWVSHG